MAFKSVKTFFFLKIISAILESTSYKYSEIFFISSAKIQAKKEHFLLSPGKSEFLTHAGSLLSNRHVNVKNSTRKKWYYF